MKYLRFYTKSKHSLIIELGVAEWIFERVFFNYRWMWVHFRSRKLKKQKTHIFQFQLFELKFPNGFPLFRKLLFISQGTISVVIKTYFWYWNHILDSKWLILRKQLIKMFPFSFNYLEFRLLEEVLIGPRYWIQLYIYIYINRLWCLYNFLNKLFWTIGYKLTNYW